MAGWLDTSQSKNLVGYVLYVDIVKPPLFSALHCKTISFTWYLA